jgi:predicted AlkP superfamily pyrophosphatase or phosphodiesterase
MLPATNLTDGRHTIKYNSRTAGRAGGTVPQPFDVTRCFRMRRNCRAVLAAATLLSTAAVLAPPAPAKSPEKPRLVVLISIDQFRGDYMTRFPHLFLPATGKDGVGGFRYLMDRGAYYPNAHYTHFPLVTAVGHAVLSTGGSPSTNGIIGNSWYVRAHDGKPGHGMYCVADEDSPIVGPAGATGAASPKNMRSTTIADELKIATNGKAKVLTVSFKDRAAILLAGRLSDTTIWFDNTTGRWVSSKFYCPGGLLPNWVVAENNKKQADRYFNATWEPLFPNEVANNAWTTRTDIVSANDNIRKQFPHRYTGGLSAPGKAYYGDLWSSPFASEMVLQTALDGVKALNIGQDEVPDYVGINLAANDYVGHAFGPNSPEAFVLTLRTDRLLADFFRGLDRTVPGGLKNVTIALSGDHGVAPIPEAMEAAGFHAGRVPGGNVKEAADTALDAAFGAEDWVAAYMDPTLYLNRQAIANRKADRRAVERVAADAIRAVDGVYMVVTRDQIEDGRTPDTGVARRVVTGFHPNVSGDLLVVLENLHVYGGGSAGTTHGSPWPYDTHLPVAIAGFGITPGRYPRNASPQEIAPTLASLVGVEAPSTATAGVLVEALKGNAE